MLLINTGRKAHTNQNTITTMAFFKKSKMNVRTREGATVTRWYPRSVLVGKTVTTDQLANRISLECTVAPADVLAVFKALSGCMGEYMAAGRSVKLDGIGSFYFSASSSGNGAASKDDCTANMINGVKVRFIPETTYQRSGGQGSGRHAVRPLTNFSIEWIDVESLVKDDDEEPEP